MRPLKTPPTPPKHMHQSLTVHFQNPLTPNHNKARANQVATCFLQGKNHTKKEKEIKEKRNTWKKHKVLKMWNLVRICTSVILVLTTVGQCTFIHKGHRHYLHWTLDHCQFLLCHGLFRCRLWHWRETWKTKNKVICFCFYSGLPYFMAIINISGSFRPWMCGVIILSNGWQSFWTNIFWYRPK